MRAENVTEAVVDHLTKQLGSLPVGAVPFAHLRLERPFPDAVYQRMMELLPATESYGDLQHSDARLPNGRSARRKLELRPAPLSRLPAEQREFWMALRAAFESPRVEAAYRAAFTEAMLERFGEKTAALKLHPSIVLLRDMGGYKISIHCDSFRKAITTQYYLPRDESKAYLGTVFHRKNAVDGTFERVEQLRFVPNTGYAFPVLADSWHSVEPMTEADAPRDSLMVIYYIDQGPVGEMLNKLKRLGHDLLSLCKPAGR